MTISNLQSVKNVKEFWRLYITFYNNVLNTFLLYIFYNRKKEI
jgi:hypothetical protein